MDTSVLALSIASLVYAASLALMNLPIREFKAWGRAAFMHSITCIALLAVIPTVTFIRGLIAPYITPYIGVDIGVGPETALAHIGQYQTMIMGWINAVNLSALALGGMQGVLMLALSPLMLVGVGVLFASIASYLFAAVFGALIVAQKFFSLLYLFSEVIRAFMALVPVLGPGMFTIGLILFAVPFGRRLGKTLIVLGAAFTLVLPPVVVAALPSPAEAEAEIQKTKEIQAYSIALDHVRVVNAATKINVFDRNGTIVHVNQGGAGIDITEVNGTKTIRHADNTGGGSDFHESRMVNYPYFKLELNEPENAPPLFISCATLPPGVSCEQVAQAVLEMLKQPESGFIDSQQEKIGDGYRLTLTMPEPGGVGKRAGVYRPNVWLLGLWMYMQGDSGKRDDPVRIIGYIIEGVGDPQQASESGGDVYEKWKYKWERFWDEVPYKKLYLENAVQEGKDTSLIWFTQTPVGSDAPLNVFVVDRALTKAECKIIDTRTEQVGNQTVTKYRYGLFYGTAWETPVTYFVHLDGAKYEVRSDWPDIQVKEVDASKLSGVVKGAETLDLDPSIMASGDSKPPKLEASPPAHYMEVYLPAGEYMAGEGDTCEEAYLNFIKEQIKTLMLEEYVYGNNTSEQDAWIKECYEQLMGEYGGYINSTGNEAGNYTGPELIEEPDELNMTSVQVQVGAPCAPSASAKVSVTVEFILLEESPYAPYKPDVEWDKFEMDEQYAGELASGEYVSEGALEGINVETHKEEWTAYPIFRLGLYRDGPVHYGQRLVVGKLMEYRSGNWEKSPIAAMIYNIFETAAEKAKSSIPGGGVPIPTLGLLVSGNGGISLIDALARLLGYTCALALGLLVFAVAADVVSGMIGGESAAKTVLSSPMSSLFTAFYQGGSISSAMRGGSRASVAGYLAGRRQEREMLKSAWEERRRDSLRWRQAQERRIASMGRLRGTVERARSRINEKLLDLREGFEQRGGALGRAGSLVTAQLSKGYTLDAHMRLLRADPAYAARYIDQARYVRQMRPAAMTPGEWAEGMARMIRTAPTRLERIALIDRIARDTRIGRSLLIREAIGGSVRAPAAFGIAALSSKPLTDGLGGRRPVIPHATTTKFSVGLLSRGSDRVEAPHIRQHRGDSYETLRETHKAIRFYEEYSRPLSTDEKARLSKTLTNIHADRPRLDGEIPGQNVTEVAVRMDDRTFSGTFWIETQDVSSLPPAVSDNMVAVRSAQEKFEPGETHEGWLFRGHDYGPQLPSDIREAFPWASGDAIDRLAADGHDVGNTLRWWEAGGETASSPAGEPSRSTSSGAEMGSGQGEAGLGHDSGPAGSKHDAHKAEGWWEE